MKRYRSPGVVPTTLATSIAAVLAAGGWSDGLAQQADASDQPQEQVIVTGTRIARDDFTSPNATASISRVDIENLGLVDVTEMIDQIPSSVTNFQPEAMGGSSFLVGATLANIRGMNTFFGTRTLTLVDSKRFVSTNNGGGVDLSVIPSALIGRMESVTGGASASYGADAVSGVVNIILDNDLDGIKLRTDFGTTGEGDGDNYTISIAGGTDVLNGRGHITASYEQQDFDPINDCTLARDWCARNRDVYDQAPSSFFGGPPPGTPIVSPYFPGELGLILTDNLRYSSSPNGTLFSNNPGATTWLQFNDAGDALIPWNPGQAAYRGPSNIVIGGDGRGINEGLVMRPEQQRDSIYTHFDYELEGGIEIYTDVSFSNNEAKQIQNQPFQLSESLCIEPDNAYLLQLDQSIQDAFAAMIPDQGGACGSYGPQNSGFPFAKTGVTLSKDWINQVARPIDTDTETQRLVVGATGDLGEKWTWDVYFQYGKTERSQIAQNYRTTNRFAMAQDAVYDSVNDEIRCRILSDDPAHDAIETQWRNFFGEDFADIYLDALAPQCVPLNPFGQAASPEALAYVYDDLTEWNVIRQRVVSATFSGQIAQGWAGPLMMAGGFDYRYDYTRNDAGGLPEPLRTDFGAQYGDPWAGELDGIEWFAEFEIPLLEGKQGARYMMLNVAARDAEQDVTNKDERGGAFKLQTDSWKASWVYSPIEMVMIRATRSSDVRAPSLRELFYRQTTPPGGAFGGSQVSNPWIEAYNDANGTTFNAQDTGKWIIGANPDLRNEVSDTETFGLVFTPPGLRNLQVSIDWFETVLKDGINYLGPQDTIDGCYNGDPLFCSKMEFGPQIPGGAPIAENNLLQWESLQVNLEPFYYSGLDISANYVMSLDNGSRISLRMLATRVLDQTVTSGGSLTQIAGQVGGNTGFLPNFEPTPEWSGNVFMTYSQNNYAVTAQARYVGSGQINKQDGWIGPEDPRWGPELVNTVATNSLGSYTIWNLNGQYDLSSRMDNVDNLTLSLRLDNVFDKAPPWSNCCVGGVNAVLYDTLGRNFRVGLQLEF